MEEIYREQLYKVLVFFDYYDIIEAVRNVKQSRYKHSKYYTITLKCLQNEAKRMIGGGW